MTVTTTFGAQYYRPPNPPREDWRRDLELMKATGLNTVKLWACWSWMDVDGAGYDFADLDELLDHADAIGLRVVINTIIENAPYRLEERVPQARYVDQEGRAVALTAAMNTPGGGWPGLCFDNPEVWDAASAFLTALVERYDAHPALEVWDVWNEPHLEPASYFPERMYCYCEASVARFIGWLRTKYDTLDALNDAWSRRYSSWTQVAPPRVFEAVPDLMDWREFWFDNLRHWLDRRLAVVRAARTPGSATTVMTHVALSGFTGQLATHTLDEYTLTENVDAFGTSSFPTWLMADDHVEHLFNLDTARDAAPGKPFWQAELQGGRGRRDGVLSTGQPDPAVVSLWMWNALASGATGVMFWQWRPELLGPESPGYGLCAPDGSPTPRVEAVRRFAAVADEPLLAGRVVDAPSVALLVSRASALHAFATDRTMALYRDAVMGAYRMLTDLDVAVTVLHEDQVVAGGVPGHIRGVYWPMPSVASEELCGRLAEHVARGGTLVSEAGPGEYAPSGHRRAQVPAHAFDGLFGVRERETTSSGAGERVTTGSGPVRVAWQRESLVVEGADVLGTFGDGEPGITRHLVGAAGGAAVLIAGYPSLAYAGAGARREADAAGGAVVRDLLGAGCPSEPDVRWAGQRPGLVTRRATAAGGARLVFAMNWTDVDEALDESASVSSVRVVHGPAHRDAGGTLVVPPRSGCLLRIG